jgi:glucokinase
MLRRDAGGRDGRDVIGCDVGGTAVKLVRLARGGGVVATVELPTPRREPSRAVVDLLARAIRELADARPGPDARPGAAAAGVALPGFLDEKRRRVVRLSNLPALDGVPLGRELGRRLGLPIVLDTDTNAGAVAESVLGAARGLRSVLYISLGTGLGVALCRRGEPVRVARHTIGHAAHLRLDAEGPRCACGGRRCAESLLSARGIVWRARRAGLSVRAPAALHAEALRPGGRAARRVWQDIGALVGDLAAVLGSLFAPDAIILGGGTAGAADVFLPSAERALHRRWPPALGSPPPLRPAALGRLAGAVGAALLARARGT